MSSEANLFTESQLATLSAVIERLIPGDRQDPGAGEAGVVNYILIALGSDYEASLPVYRQGLSALNAYTQTRNSDIFLALDPASQDDLLREVENGDGGKPLSQFFQLVLKHSIEGMFGDPWWGGNKDYVGWKLLGYPGPQYEWTVAEQQLDVVLDPRYGDVSTGKN